MYEWIIWVLLAPLAILLWMIRIMGTLLQLHEEVIDEITGGLTLFYGWILALPAWLLAALRLPDAWNPFLAAFAALF